MARFKSTLDDVHVAAPCNFDWETMSGDDRQRFCGQCQLNVYNLSEMTRADAETFVGRAEGRVCIRFYRRRDGSVITRNCPVGLSALKRRMSRVAHALGSVALSFLAGVGLHVATEKVLMAIADRAVNPIMTSVDITTTSRELSDEEFENVQGFMLRGSDLDEYKRRHHLKPITSRRIDDR